MHNVDGLSVSPVQFSVALRPQRPEGLLGTGEPRTVTSTFTQFLSSEVSPGHFKTLLQKQKEHFVARNLMYLIITATNCSMKYYYFSFFFSFCGVGGAGGGGGEEKRGIEKPMDSCRICEDLLRTQRVKFYSGPITSNQGNQSRQDL